jgi:hypothetical protein
MKWNGHVSKGASFVYRSKRQNGPLFLLTLLAALSGLQILLSVISLAMLGVARCPAGVSDDAINRLTTAYSAQRIVTLNVRESYTFQLRSGARRVINVLALHEHRDSVIRLMSRAEVQIAVDGRPLALVCEPYTTSLAGNRGSGGGRSGGG